jgi:hypothetical protein
MIWAVLSKVYLVMRMENPASFSLEAIVFGL